jgi:DNA-binding transcriptional ArsR family regulator
MGAGKQKLRRLSRMQKGLSGLMQNSCCDFNDFMKAIADETRQNILALLKDGEMSVGELAEHFNLAQPTMSHHLTILRRVKLVSSRRAGQHIFYRSNLACVVECYQELATRFKISEKNN